MTQHTPEKQVLPIKWRDLFHVKQQKNGYKKNTCFT